MSQALFARSVDALWRIAADRVIVRHSRRSLADDGADLTGDVALVWVALDEPATLPEVVERLAEEGLPKSTEDVGKAIDQLVLAGWVRAISTGL